jgi:hypothetical protein
MVSTRSGGQLTTLYQNGGSHLSIELWPENEWFWYVVVVVMLVVEKVEKETARMEYQYLSNLPTCPNRSWMPDKAVADIGFEQTLGYLNVHQETDLHKGIIIGYNMMQQQQCSMGSNNIWIEDL